MLRWGKLLSVTILMQVGVQALAFLSGILVIRWLSIEQYAMYTLANTMLATMTMLADAGVTSGVMSQGGKVWDDPKRLGAVMATGMALRRRFVVFSLVLSIPILFVLLVRHGASTWMSVLLIACIVPAFSASLCGRVLEVAPKLHQNVIGLQRAQVGGNLVRLIATAATLLLVPIAAAAILVAGISQWFINFFYQKVARPYADPNANEDQSVRREILRIVRRSLPGAIYVSFLGQINVWMISIFGSTESVAEIGALSRLAIAIAFFNVVFGMLIVPRFSRLATDRALLVRRFLQIQAMVWTLAVGFVVVVWLFPEPMLWILGANYSGLATELVLMAAVSSFGLIAGSVQSINASRGYIINPWAFITLNFTIITAAYFVSPPTDTLAALKASFLGTMLGPLIHSANFWFHVRSDDPLENQTLAATA